jgi:hypothetical protein
MGVKFGVMGVFTNLYEIVLLENTTMVIWILVVLFSQEMETRSIA